MQGYGGCDLPRNELALLTRRFEENTYSSELFSFVIANVSSISIQPVFVEDALPESRRNLVTRLSNGEGDKLAHFPNNRWERVSVGRIEDDGGGDPSVAFFLFGSGVCAWC